MTIQCDRTVYIVVHCDFLVDLFPSAELVIYVRLISKKKLVTVRVSH